MAYRDEEKDRRKDRFIRSEDDWGPMFVVAGLILGLIAVGYMIATAILG